MQTDDGRGGNGGGLAGWVGVGWVPASSTAQLGPVPAVRHTGVLRVDDDGPSSQRICDAVGQLHGPDRAAGHAHALHDGAGQPRARLARHRRRCGLQQPSTCRTRRIQLAHAECTQQAAAAAAAPQRDEARVDVPPWRRSRAFRGTPPRVVAPAGFDWGYDSGGECGVPFERRFKMPLSGPDKPWCAGWAHPAHHGLSGPDRGILKRRSNGTPHSPPLSYPQSKPAGATTRGGVPLNALERRQGGTSTRASSRCGAAAAAAACCVHSACAS